MLLTKNVFIDTSVFITHNFDYSSVQLCRLEELAQEKNAHLVTTTIVVAEIEANIRKRVDAIASALKRFRKDHPISRILATDELVPVSSTFAPDPAYKHLIGKFRDYLNRTETEIVGLELSTPSEVFDWYFRQVAPFRGGEKKHEFPDAFTVSALEAWCAKRQEQLYVVAGDGDLTEYCSSSKNLIRLARPAEFIDLFLRQTAFMRLVEESTTERVEQVREAVRIRFEELGFYLDDEQGDVEHVEVEDVEVEDLSLLDVTRGIARFEMFVSVGFRAFVSYEDTETSIWDSEDKVSIPMRNIRQRLVRRFYRAVVLSLRITETGKFDSVVGIEFPSLDIPITVNRYSEQ